MNMANKQEKIWITASGSDEKSVSLTRNGSNLACPSLDMDPVIK